MTPDRAHALTSWLPDRFFVELLGVASRLRVENPADLLLALYSESNLKHGAAYRNANGYPTAVGLNQITRVRSDAMGLTQPKGSDAPRVALLDLSEIDQLPYVEKSFLSTGFHGPYTSAGHVYIANFAPYYLPQAHKPDQILYSDPGIVHANGTINKNHDGVITVREVNEWLRDKDREGSERYQAALERLRAASALDTGTSRGFVTVGTIVAIAATAGVIGGAAWWLTHG